jgi:hypothetical protein
MGATCPSNLILPGPNKKSKVMWDHTIAQAIRRRLPTYSMPVSGQRTKWTVLPHETTKMNK